MKKIIPFLFLVILMAGSVWADAAIRVNLINQDPNPATPGKYVDLNFQIENIGDKAADDFMIELIPEFPFSLDPNEEKVKDIGSISSGRQGDDAVLTTFTVRVDDKAVNGKNKIKIRYKKNKYDDWTYQDFDVMVQSSSYTLSVSRVVTTPEILAPGSKGKIDITVKNIGYNTLKDLSVKLVVASYSTSGFSSIVPISPLYSSSEKKIEFLEPNKDITFSFNVIAKPDAEPGVYTIPLEITFYDSTNKATQISDFIGLEIGAKPDLELMIDKSNIFKSESKGTVSIKIVNKGITNANFVNAEVAVSKDYNILSYNREFYIGEIDSDDYETFDLNLFIPKTNKREITIPVKLTFKDSNNKEYQEIHNVTIKLYSKEEIAKYIKEKNSSTNKILIGLVVVFGLVFILRKKRNKKKR